MSDFIPNPEYCAFQAMIETGFIPDDYMKSARWNDHDSDFHKFWNLFIEKLNNESHQMIVPKSYRADRIEVEEYID